MRCRGSWPCFRVCLDGNASCALFFLTKSLAYDTDILPLEQTVIVWDTFVQADEIFPLYFAMAILRSVRSQLLCMGLDECVLFKSNITINIESCLNQANMLRVSTPLDFVDTHIRQNAPWKGCISSICDCRKHSWPSTFPHQRNGKKSINETSLRLESLSW